MSENLRRRQTEMVIDALPEFTPQKRRRTPRKGLVLYLIRHFQACLQSLGQMSRSPVASFMTVLVIGIALALPTGLFVMLNNVASLGQGWDGGTQVSLYLKMDVTQTQVQGLMNQLRSRPDITAVSYISPEQGLAEFKKQSDFGNALDVLKDNPLPGVILVKPTLNLQTPEAVSQLVSSLQQLQPVETAKLDMQWVKRLFAMIEVAQHLVYALALLFGLGVLLIIGHTIHLATQNYRQDIEVYKLVGATDSFVRRPFLYTGMLYGFFGGIIAWLSVSLVLWWLSSPAQHLANLYGSQAHIRGLGFHSGITLLLAAIVLGLLGSRIAVNKHLRAV